LKADKDDEIESR